MPQGVTFPLIKTRAIDDVPMLGTTLLERRKLRRILPTKPNAQELTIELKRLNDVSAYPKRWWFVTSIAG